MNNTSHSIRNTGFIFLLFIIGCFLRIFVENQVSFLRHISTLYYVLLAMVMISYFSTCIIDKRIRKYLVAVASMVLFWFVLRGAKYFVFGEIGVIARHLWYLYYVPMLMIPLLSFLAILTIDRKETKGLAVLQFVTVAISVVLIFLILTNDIHQWAFQFPMGIANWDDEYSRGILYYLVWVWDSMLFVACTVVLFRKCRLVSGRQQIWVPVLPVIFGVFGLLCSMLEIFTINGKQVFNYAETACYTMAGYWIGCLSCGLIISNKGYDILFSLSDIAAQITDKSYHTVYRSKNAVELSREQLRANTNIMINETIRLHRKEIRGGYVYWQNDITELNQINNKLIELREQLDEETELIRLASELQEKRAQLEQKMIVYDTIAIRVQPWLLKISSLTDAVKENPTSFEYNMQRICMYGIYIKRYANMMLLSASRDRKIPSTELHLAVLESLHHLENMGIVAECMHLEEVEMSLVSALNAYEEFETLLEQALSTVKGVWVVLKNDAMKVTFEDAVVAALEQWNVVVTIEEGSSYVTIPIGEGE